MIQRVQLDPGKLGIVLAIADMYRQIQKTVSASLRDEQPVG
jgi:hypothetical protein